jgi:hypothetical protein
LTQRFERIFLATSAFFLPYRVENEWSCAWPDMIGGSSSGRWRLRNDGAIPYPDPDPDPARDLARSTHYTSALPPLRKHTRVSPIFEMVSFIFSYSNLYISMTCEPYCRGL